MYKKIEELFNKGMEYLQNGDYQQAEIKFKEAKQVALSQEK